MSFYTIECKTWAWRRLYQLMGVRPKPSDVYLVEIVPTSGHSFITDVEMPGGAIAQPAWHNHYAVGVGDTWYDEAYPDGLSSEDFRKRFKLRQHLDFNIHEDWWTHFS